MEKEITLHDRLVAIQSELKAPKGQYNSFGKYKYRSAEDILEAVKPLLKKYGCKLTIMDEIVLVGDRYYVKAIPTISDGTQSLSVCGWAREAETKTGMDASQITGTASSYARKYALNGLLCIDDTADSDTTNQGESSSAAPAPAPAKKSPAPKKQGAAKKTIITDKNIKQVVDWVCAVPEGDQRDARIKKAEDSYEWPGNLHEAFLTMIDLTE